MAYQRQRISKKLVDKEELKQRLDADPRYSEDIKEYANLRKERTVLERKARELEDRRGELTVEEIKLQKTRTVFSRLSAKLVRIRRLMEIQTMDCRSARIKRNRELAEEASDIKTRLNTLDGRLRMLEHNTGTRKGQVFRELFEEETARILSEKATKSMKSDEQS